MHYLAALRPFLRRVRPDFGDLLPWKDVLDRDEGIWSTKDDGLMAIFRLWPMDIVALETTEQGAIMLRVNDAFKRLPAGWAVWIHARRVPYTEYPDAVWPHPIADVLDREYRAHLTATGARWTTEIYLTLWRRLPKGTAKQIRPLLVDEPYRPVINGASAGLGAFRHEVSRFIDIVGLACRDVKQLDGHAGATYLHTWVSLHDDPVELPDDATRMSYRLRDCGFWPGLIPTIGTATHREYIRALDLNYKIPRRIQAGLFQRLNTLPIAYEWVTRWITMDATKAESRTLNTQINILSTKQGFKAQVFTRTRDKTVEVANSYVDQQAQDADAAQKQMLSDEAAHGFLNTTWLVRDADLDEADRKIGLISGVIRRAGCLANVEDLNATEAYLGAIPGQVHLNVRRLEMNTMNLTDLGPFHLPWGGAPSNAHLHGPAVCQALTDGCMPYALNTHVGDLGFSTVIGPLGSGKSTYEAFVNYLQWLRYDGSRVIGFDVGNSWRCVTQALHGTYHNLNRGDAKIQALQGIDDPKEFPFIYSWLLARLAEATLPPTPDITRCVMAGVNRLRHSSAPRMMRSLVDCLLTIKNKIEPEARAKNAEDLMVAVRTYAAVIEALSKFAQGGVYGHLTDSPVDGLSIGRIHTFELEKLLEISEVWPAVLSLIFHRLEGSLDGSPTRLLFGEAWVVFSIQEFMRGLKDWMPSWRRKNASGSFSTQSISQLLHNPLTPFLYESCQVRHFLPNSQALDSESRQGYEGMRLNSEELLLLTKARPKRDVYVVRPDGRRLIDMALPPMARSICGANSQELLALMDLLVDRYGADEFPYRWLAAQGFEDAARHVMQALEGEHYDTAAELLARAESLDRVGAAGPGGTW